MNCPTCNTDIKQFNDSLIEYEHNRKEHPMYTRYYSQINLYKLYFTKYELQTCCLHYFFSVSKDDIDYCNIYKLMNSHSPSCYTFTQKGICTSCRKYAIIELQKLIIKESATYYDSITRNIKLNKSYVCSYIYTKYILTKNNKLFNKETFILFKNIFYQALETCEFPSNCYLKPSNFKNNYCHCGRCALYNSSYCRNHAPINDVYYSKYRAWTIKYRYNDILDFL